MRFTRQEADNWHQEVPGARWFKADLHTHTIDDHPGSRAKLPHGINGPLDSEQTISDYARRFLQSAVARGVHVLGVTPHSPRVGEGADTSTVWRIVEEWNNGFDDDGIPFRRKIYAVLPGFEPKLKQGKSGLHILFLFDPEIGRDNYLKAFDLVMGGVSPWREETLQVSNKSCEDAFDELYNFHDRECPEDGYGQRRWRYIVLAPHILAATGLLGAQKAQVLELFEHAAVAGLELGDGKLPEDTVKDRSWLVDGMAKYRQAFFHGSDAYTVDDIGKRHTWLKLASPRIEALRQAFIASDSRIRIGYERNVNGSLSEIPKPPDITVNQRPWLKSVTVSGSASFFGASGQGKPGAHFDLSPDLTCIIGGSMTGKSTFLDGLRVHVDAPLPDDHTLVDQVKARGRERFLGGSPEVELECPGQDTTAKLHEQWPAVFYTQNELQRLAQNPEAVEDILARLVVAEKQIIRSIKNQFSAIDRELSDAAKRLSKLYEDLADAEQAFERSRSATAEIASFSDAGVEQLNQVSSNARRWQEFEKAARELAIDLDRVMDSAEAVDLPENDDSLTNAVRDAGRSAHVVDLRARWHRIRDSIKSARDELADANVATRSITDTLEADQRVVRVQVDRELAARGLDGARINQLQAINHQASLLASYDAHLTQVRGKLAATEHSFETLLADRQGLVCQHRSAFDRVIKTVLSQFNGRISPRRIDDGHRKPLDLFLKGLAQKGITRWWNDLSDEQKPTPQELLKKLNANQLADVGMSGVVQATFRQCLTLSKRRELAALRCRDRYVLESKMDDGSYRWLDDLSGGQRVNLLLSLLLETYDERPLVIDQPEDELDNRFLFETMLPALKRLKGHRQIIVATHNANIVVNGDADQVIQLEATADRGHVARSGAIEDPTVRDAIVQTVDGGDEAFRLRRLKYGF